MPKPDRLTLVYQAGIDTMTEGRLTKADAERIMQIVDRTLPLIMPIVVLSNAQARMFKLALFCDIAVIHLSLGLRLDELTRAENFDLIHDVMGIYQNLDRETGTLRDCFMPRFVAQQA